jgi:SWIM/SEC-C metal-binding protein
VARIGTQRHPAIVRVKTAARAQQLIAFCQDEGIQVIVGVEPDQAEDISDIERTLNPSEPVQALPSVGRNAPCPCGSGNKFKKCCDGLPARS